MSVVRLSCHFRPHLTPDCMGEREPAGASQPEQALELLPNQESGLVGFKCLKKLAIPKVNRFFES